VGLPGWGPWRCSAVEGVGRQHLPRIPSISMDRTQVAGKLYLLAQEADGSLDRGLLHRIQSTGAMLVEQVMGRGAAPAEAIRAVEIPVLELGMAIARMGLVQAAGERLAGELMAASDVLSLLGDPPPDRTAPNADELHIEPGLWGYVREMAELGQWDHVASAAVRYVESRLREWADGFQGSANDLASPRLVTSRSS
jgi:hypothetical protein